MKEKWLLIPLASLVFVSCEKKEESLPPAAPAAERIKPAPTKIEPVPDSVPAPAAVERSTADKAPESSAPPTPVTPAVAPPPVAPVAKPAIPTAKKVEGQPGFVFSPFSDNMIDVRDMPAGTLVQDPGYPASEKRYFRVP